MSTHVAFLEDRERGETLDMLYFDSRLCMEEVLEGELDGTVRPVVAPAGEYVRGDGTTVSYGAYPAPDYPSYTVVCAACGTVMHEGEDS
jgi:hypothetical protein